jgi:hypothetical protein
MKIIKFSPIFCLVLFLGAFTAFSQSDSHPNFSGDWALNVAESKVSKGTSREVLELSASTTLRIVHNEPEFTASTMRLDTGAVVTSSTYYTDGREIKSDDGHSVEKTKWDGKKLITQRKPLMKEPDRQGRKPDGTVNIGGGTVKREFRMEWELSPNGRLTQKITTTTKSDIQIMDRRTVVEDKTEIIKVYDPIKTSH